MVELNYYGNEESLNEETCLVIQEWNESIAFVLRLYGEPVERINFDLETAKVLSSQLQQLILKMESDGRLD